MATPQTIQALLLKKALLYIAVSTLIVVLIWIGSGTYFSTKRSTLPEDLQQKTLPITPSIDIQIIQTLKSRRSFTEAELSNFPISKEIIATNKNVIASPTPKPKVAVSKLATQSAQPSTASGSAQTP